MAGETLQLFDTIENRQIQFGQKRRLVWIFGMPGIVPLCLVCVTDCGPPVMYWTGVWGAWDGPDTGEKLAFQRCRFGLLRNRLSTLGT